MCTPVDATRAPIILSLKYLQLPLALGPQKSSPYRPLKKTLTSSRSPLFFVRLRPSEISLVIFQKNRGSCQVPGGSGEDEDDDLVGG